MGIRLVVTVLAVLALAGCGGAPSTPQEQDEVFLERVQESSSVLAEVSKAELVDFGRARCDGADAGVPRLEVEVFGPVQYGWPQHDVAMMIDAAYEVYCPQHAAR